MEEPASHKATGHSTRPSARSHADNGNFSSQSRSSSKTATQKARDLEVLLPTTEITQHLQAQDSKDSHSTATGNATATSPTKSEVNDIPAEKDTKAEKVAEQETDKGGKAAEVKVKADPEKPQLKAKCLYRLEYRDQNDNLLHEKESDTAAGAEPPKRDEAVIEVITTIRVKQTETASSKEFKPQSARGKKETTELRINSLNLTNAIRAIVSYYPGTYLLEEPLTFTAPYKLLVHHRKLLAEYKSQHPPSHDAEYVEETNEHIDVLLGFLSEHFGTDLDAEEERHRQNPPICTFEYAWLLFQPGVDIYTVPSDFPPNTPLSVHVVSHVSGGLVDGEFSPYKISMWNLESDGECVGRYNHGVEIPPFDGEREITSLTAYPLSILAEAKRLSIEEALIERGRRYYEFTKICHKQFNGYTLTNPRRRYDTQVVLDTYLYFTIYPKEDNTELNLNFDAASGVSGCNCDRCRKFKRPAGKAKYGNYDKLKLKAARPEGDRDLTPHQYMLCTQKVYGFPLKQRAWQMFDMDGISEIAFDKEIMNELVLDPPSNKTLIKALAKRYTEAPADLEIGPDTDPSIIPQNIPIKKDIWSADRVEGKGEGQIILLHGPPGVGKTLTAESVAAFVERPLLSLSVGDIGTYAQYVETNLRDWMKKARRWGAILLIDEADIYLGERSPHNFKHNSLVSVFLNNLEYYSGILFLTTNRVGVFDEAFASRIHIPIGYSPFKEATREQVWENMTKRLERERKGSVKVELSFKKYYRNDKELKKLEWNGREIRNAFQTAVSLAEFNAKEDGLDVAELKDEFLDQVVQMSLRFKEYLATFPGGDARKKAWNYGKRNDAFMASN